MATLDLAVATCCLVAAGLAGLRWLRVAQREGWVLGAASRWALRWWTLEVNAAVGVVALASLVAAPVFRPAALTTAVAVVVGPLGLPLRGRRPGPLAWTARARRVATIAGGIAVAVVAAGLLVGPGTAAVLAGVVAVLSPGLIDTAGLVAGGADPAEGVVSTGIESPAALSRLAAGPSARKRVLVTAGPHGAAGEDLAERAVSVATHLVIIGRHARRALQHGAARGPSGCTIVLCDDVGHAEVWVDTETGPDDTVVWLAVPPDHVP